MIPKPRKADSMRKNYLKRDIDSPNNLFRGYIKRKSKLVYGVPIIKSLSIPKHEKSSNASKNPEDSQG